MPIAYRPMYKFKSKSIIISNFVIVNSNIKHYNTFKTNIDYKHHIGLV